MVETTGGFTSAGLAHEAEALVLPSLTQAQAIEIGEIGLSEELHAIHGGGLALNVAGTGLAGILLVSGLPQAQDHLLGVEIITEYLARQGENA